DQAERLGGVEVDDQLESGRLLDWQIGRLGAIEDLSGVNSLLANVMNKAWSIAHQAAGRGEIARSIDRRNNVARRQCHELIDAIVEERIEGYEERAVTKLGKGRISGLDLAFGSGLQDMELQPLRTCRFPHVSNHGLGSNRVVRVQQQGDHA